MSDTPIIVPSPAPKNSLMVMADLLVKVVAAIAVAIIAARKDPQPAPAPEPAPLVIPDRPKPAPSPAPDEEDDPSVQATASPLGAAAKKYARGLPKMFRDMKGKTKVEAHDIDKAHYKILGDALNAAFDAATDDSGAIIKPKALNNQLEDAAVAVGGK